MSWKARVVTISDENPTEVEKAYSAVIAMIELRHNLDLTENALVVAIKNSAK